MLTTLIKKKERDQLERYTNFWKLVQNSTNSPIFPKLSLAISILSTTLSMTYTSRYPWLSMIPWLSLTMVKRILLFLTLPDCLNPATSAIYWKLLTVKGRIGRRSDFICNFKHSILAIAMTVCNHKLIITK